MDLESIGIGALAILFAVVMFIISAIIVVVCAMAIEYVMDLLGFQIDKMLYWTGVCLVILFGTFCKSSKKESD